MSSIFVGGISLSSTFWVEALTGIDGESPANKTVRQRHDNIRAGVLGE
jgi:hypothetical protein